MVDPEPDIGSGADEGFDDETMGAPDVGTRSGVDPSERLRGLILYLARSLVDAPDVVVVEADRRGQGVHLTLRVPEEELGKVIGRQGRIARAMRTALMIAGSRDDVRASLDIEG